MQVIIVQLLSSTIQYAGCVNISIIPTPDSPCPGATKGEPCFTLQQYIDNPSASSDVVLEMNPGKHVIVSQLFVSSISSFAMRAIESTVRAIESTVSVLCGQELQPSNYYWFIFMQVQIIQVSGITFNGCTMQLAGNNAGKTTNATFTKTSFVNRSPYINCLRPDSHGGILDIGTYISVQIEQCVFSDNSAQYGAIRSAGYNLTVDQSIFKNNSGCIGGAAIYATNWYANILNSNFSNNQNYFPSQRGGAVYVSAREVSVANSRFSGNAAIGKGGGLYADSSGSVTITNTYFSENVVKSSNGDGGALVVYASKGSFITGCHFSGNNAGYTSGNGGAVYVQSGDATMTDCSFRDNVAGSQGGAIATYQFSNITISNTTFINNTASTGGGGAIYVTGSYTNISLTSNTFSYNTAAGCGTLDIRESYHCSADLTGNTFTHNRAIGQIFGVNSGGVLCTRNASVLIRDNNFSDNSATHDAGVLQVDESDITIERSKFSNNTAGGNGGVLHTNFYPVSYTIIDSSFTNNKADNGGVMFIGKADSQVNVSGGTFAYNQAKNRGGVIDITGSTLYIDRASICKNSANLGRVVSACYSKVAISNPIIPGRPDPDRPHCSLYDCLNITVLH